jgi:hypothetical protein
LLFIVNQYIIIVYKYYNTITMKNIIRIAIGTGAILLVPLVLTLLGSGVDGDGWHWTLSDFVIMGILIFGTGLIYECIIKKIKNSTHRVYFAIALVVAFLLVWAELAVGLFGTPFAGS